MLARSRERTARGDQERLWTPQVGFGLLYNRNTTLLNNIDFYYKNDLPTSDLSSGFSIQLPLFNAGLRAKSKESAAEALRAKVEAEQAQRQTDLHIAELTGSLRELDAHRRR